MDEEEPDLVTSSRSGRAVIGGIAFHIGIRRMTTEAVWTLEVVDPDGTSHVWDEPFASAAQARNAAIAAIKEDGPEAFMRGEEAADNVVPFRRP